MRIDESRDLARDLDLIGGSGSVGGLSDAELIGRFADRRGEATAAAEVAFEALVRRHGGMVLGACRRVLRDPDAAEDAFQATFLVLARKAGSVRVEGSLAPWLHGVARRVAARARDQSRRRRLLEEKAGARADAEAPAPPDDLGPILFEELDRLPAKYRSPVVLCHLEGMTHEEAGRHLGWPVGTVSGRLSRARDLLRARLTRRGVAPSVSVAAALAGRDALATMTTHLPGATARLAIRFAGGGAVPESVLQLTRGVLIAMFAHQIKVGVLAASAVAVLTIGAGLVSAQFAGELLPPIRDIPGFPKLAEQQRKAQQDMFKPQAAPAGPALATTESGSIVAATLPDGRSVSALSLNGGVWREYPVAEGHHAMPILHDNILALGISGPEVRELAVFDAQVENGTWSRQPLAKPFNGEVVPTVSGGVALFQVGNDFHAYSVGNRGKGEWGVLHLEGNEPATVRFGCNTPVGPLAGEFKAIFVQQGKTLYVFSIPLARWSGGVEPKTFERKATEPKATEPKATDPTQPTRRTPF